PHRVLSDTIEDGVAETRAACALHVLIVDARELPIGFAAAMHEKSQTGIGKFRTQLVARARRLKRAVVEALGQDLEVRLHVRPGSEIVTCMAEIACLGEQAGIE